MNKSVLNECLEILQKLTEVQLLNDESYSDEAVNILLDNGVESTKEGLVGIDAEEYEEIKANLLS